MCGCSASFNLAVLLAACGLLTVDVAGDVAGSPSSLNNDPHCSLLFSVVLDLENGSSFLHNGIKYPAELRWTDGNVTYGCICRLRNCLRKCCRNDEVLRRNSKKEKICQKMPQNDTEPTSVEASTPDLRLAKNQMSEDIQNINKLREHFLLVQDTWDGCPGRLFDINPDEYGDDTIILQANGSFVDVEGKVFPFWNYCIDWKVTVDRIGILVCWTQDMQRLEQNQINVPYEFHYHVGIMISIPFLVATFLVYAIIPELRNLYGKTFMCYVICLIIGYVFLILVNYIQMSLIRTLCFTTAFIIHFSFLASFFWLNVMCFDIWWTFGGFRSLQGSMKQREKKKFVMYSIYAWGSASILTIICAIMDFVPSVPREFIRPEFAVTKCWFKTDEARAIYFYGPMGITVICNIFLFISTAMKIVRHKKDTAKELKTSESKRHDDNKQWFNLYLKLFIVMGISWSMEIISWLFKSAPAAVWYLTDLTNTLQGLIIFIIFVWKEKIKRLLLKRFGLEDRSWFSRNSTRSGVHSSNSRTCNSSGVMSLQEKVNPYTQTSSRAKSSSDEADKYCAVRENSIM